MSDPRNPDTPVQVTTLANLAQILPYLLGHYPDDSIALHAPGPNFHDGPTMTCPLPEDPADWQAVAQTLVRQFANHAKTQEHNLDQGVIIYLCREPRADQTPWDTAALLAPVADWLTIALGDHHATVLQTIGLVANRWWAYECPNEGCCEGEPLPSSDDPTSITAQMERHDRAPVRRTRDIAKEFRATEDTNIIKALDHATTRFNSKCATQAGRDAALLLTVEQIDFAMSQFRDGATALSHDLTAQLIVGLQADAAVTAGMAHTEDEDLPHARKLWAYLARHCAEPFQKEGVPILTLYALAAWRQDDLITARLALCDAITTNPDYELSLGVHLATVDNENPQQWLAPAREDHSHRTLRLRHAVQVASEYRPVTDSTAGRYRDALDQASAHYDAQTLTGRGRLLARYGTIDIVGGALADFRNGRPHLLDEIAARIILGLQDRQARDAALSTGDEADLPVERLLWGYLARRCVPPHTDKATPLLTLLGWVAWRQGDTIAASHALADALDIDPDYRLAQSLLDGINNGCDPAPLLAIYREESQRFAADRAHLDSL
ncbi:DUF4192 domain-containing protein [Streptomyces sp. NPDC020412]|uniref:DUF4192 domain-containing protein n=1 Tax=Streptomyces sp. NPDC020412 TaxID=3365073 RepID=UPI0037BAD93A